MLLVNILILSPMAIFATLALKFVTKEVIKSFQNMEDDI